MTKPITCSKSAFWIVFGVEFAGFIHTVFTKITKAGDTYLLDYHPGGNKEKNQTNIHGNDYWKIYKENKKGKTETLGRIGHEGFEKYDKIHNEPVYIDGILMNGE